MTGGTWQLEATFEPEWLQAHKRARVEPKASRVIDEFTLVVTSTPSVDVCDPLETALRATFVSGRSAVAHKM